MEKNEKIALSIVIPALNESENIGELIEQIDRFCAPVADYEVIVIDDRSTDATFDVAMGLAARYPVRVFRKQGAPGKAQALLEGFSYARFDHIGMIDADLQYPPEAIPAMLEKLAGEADIVVAARRTHNEGFLRSTASKIFSFVFVGLLHRISCDSQSGLKMFKKKILNEVSVSPSPWTFDLEFLVKARNCGYRIEGHDITFAARTRGKSKINFLSSSYEIASRAILLKVRTRSPQHISPRESFGMVGAGIVHKARRFVTHTTLHHSTSAVESFALWQKVAFFVAVSAVILGVARAPLATGVAVMAVLSAVYFLDTVFNLYIVIRSLRNAPEIKHAPEELAAIPDSALPVYSILCPLYREAHVLPHFLDAIGRLDWPKEKLDVLLLLEQNDRETIAAAHQLTLPPYVRIIVVPHSMPKTKPKACNYGLGYARGDYLVIYDAEDDPDPQQLKIAYLAFQKVPKNVTCLQAKLNYYNPQQNLLTRLFTAEYSLWFDITLTGLQSLNTYIPLGGTSNHFRLSALRELEGWDPFNVTEDCDLGARLFKRGYKTAIIDSTTLEEANSHLGNWLRQRSRWIKGYIQTYLVHMRQPVKFLRTHGIHAFIFQLLVGGKIAFALINPILWVTTIVYFSFRAVAGPAIEALFPPAVFFMAAISLIFGNFLFLYYYMIGCAKRQQWSLMKYVYFVPFYWLMTSIAAYKAAYQLLVKPHYWEKTRHGLHVQKPIPEAPEAIPEPQPAVAVAVEQSILRRLIGAASRALLPKEAADSGWMLVAAMVISNILNLGYNLILGRTVSLQDLGLIVFVNTLWYVLAVFVGALGSTVTYTTGYIGAQGSEASYGYTRHLLRKVLILMLLITIGWLAAVPALTNFFKLPNPLVLVFFAPLFAAGALASIVRGFLHGVLRYKAAASILIVETLVKFVGLIALLAVDLPAFVYLSIPAGIVVAAGLAIRYLRAYRRIPTIATYSFPWKFYSASLIASLASVAFITLDVILAKHYLSPEAAGVYSLVSLAGKMIFFLGSLPNVFMLSLVARAEGAQEKTKLIFNKIFGTTVLLAATGYCVIGVFGFVTMPLLWGEYARAAVPLTNMFAVGVALYALSTTIITYHLARKEYSYSALSLFFSGALVATISFAHESVESIVTAVSVISALQFVVLYGIHLASNTAPYIQRALFDFFDAFISLPVPQPVESGKKRILIFNWRDMRHAYAGGAEVYVYEIARRLVADGHAVTVFCGNDGESPRHETIDGISVIRRGGFYFVYLWAFLYYITQLRHRHDVIIDSHNGVPFFSPLYSRKTIYCLVHHVHQQVFTRALVRPLAWFARFLEGGLMPLVYRYVSFITVSESSKQEIERLGMGRGGIEIVNPGVDLTLLTPGEKSMTPLVVYVGRLKEYKSLDILLYAFTRVAAAKPAARLVIAGEGDEMESLQSLASSLNLSHAVSFRGRVSEEEKIALLRQAWVFVNPSFIEGWGITTIEANACATPVIASNVPGLRDSVRHDASGFLVDYGDSKAFADRIMHIIDNVDTRHAMMRGAREWASQFGWDRSSRSFASIVTRQFAYTPRRAYTRISLIILMLVTMSLFAQAIIHSSAKASVLWSRKHAIEDSVIIEPVGDDERRVAILEKIEITLLDQ